MVPKKMSKVQLLVGESLNSCGKLLYDAAKLLHSLTITCFTGTRH